MLAAKINALLFISFPFHMGILQTQMIENMPVMEVKTFPRSCLDYQRAGQRANGLYSIVGPNGESLTVYCDFSSEPGAAWTLVVSWALKNNKVFQSTTYTVDMPVNERTPNWVSYRLSKAQMLSIKTRSTHWRATCSFNKYGVDLTDYLRVNFKSIDLTSFLGSWECKKVEYINIRGHAASHKTAAFWQVLSTYTFTIDSPASEHRCEFGAKKGSVASEDNFGYYGVTNTRFRCTENQESTTQFWFGGYA